METTVRTAICVPSVNCTSMAKASKSIFRWLAVIRTPKISARSGICSGKPQVSAREDDRGTGNGELALIVKASSLLWVSSRPNLRDDTIEPILAKILGRSKSMDLYAVWSGDQKAP
jgi:hypothetical protein